MPFTIRVSLAGLSGAGKTETLKSLCPDAYLVAEEERTPTKEEAEAWEISLDTKIPTSKVPNFGNLILNEKIEISNNFSGILQENDILALIFDTCGQESFYDIRKATITGSDGILFVIDSAIPILRQAKKIIRIFNEILSYFNEIPPVSILCNKQDIIEKRKMEKGYRSKAHMIKQILNTYLTEYKYKIEYFNTSALENWGLKEAVENLIKRIMNPEEEKVSNLNKKVKRKDIDFYKSPLPQQHKKDEISESISKKLDQIKTKKVKDIIKQIEDREDNNE